MMRRLIKFPVVILLMCWFISACTASYVQTGKTYAHFFVVPTIFPDGSSTENTVLKLKEYLLKEAGGYTELGTSQGGWVNQHGENETENNILFFVTTQKDISVSLKEFIVKNFKVEYPYVIVWGVL